ncbi:ParB N-terminal domain-containing protein, partial [Pseudonocardia bannensis]
YFRPRSQRTRKRWERLAVAQRRGETIPPIDVYRVGGLHFVRDGHHRVSVAHALGLRTIEAKVTEVTTRIDPNGIVHRGDLITKDLRRVLLDRVPLSGRALESITVTDPWSYAELSKTVEAWGFRLMQHEGRFLDRETVARRWWSEEFTPVVRMLRQAELIGDRTDAEAYLQLACQRYRLLRTHRWDDEVVDHLRNDPGP